MLLFTLIFPCFIIKKSFVNHIFHRSVISFYLSLRLRMQGFAVDMPDIIFLTEILFERGSYIAWFIV